MPQMLHLEEGREPPPADFVRTYNPETLDLAGVLPKKWHDAGRFVVGNLYLRRHQDRRYEKDDFVPLSRNYMRRYLPWRNYADIGRGLTAAKVIEPETNDRGTATYTVGREGKSYRLTEPYRNAQYRAHRLTNPYLVRKFYAQKASYDARVLNVEVYQHLRKNLGRVRLTANWPTPSLPVARIADGDFFCPPCKQGRFHTNISNLDREFREFIRWEDRKVFAIDAANSQPFIMALTAANRGELPTREFLQYQEWRRNKARPCAQEGLASSATSGPLPARPGKNGAQGVGRRPRLW